MSLTRRFLLAGGALVPLAASDAHATPVQVEMLIRQLIGDGRVEKGKIKLELPLLVENGNTVAMTVSVDAPVGAVDSLHVFAGGNPLPEVLRWKFGPRAGVPSVQTRIRLATSQTVTAVAKMRDGTFRQDSIELLVTLSACIDD